MRLYLRKVLIRGIISEVFDYKGNFLMKINHRGECSTYVEVKGDLVYFLVDYKYSKNPDYYNEFIVNISQEKIIKHNTYKEDDPVFSYNFDSSYNLYFADATDEEMLQILLVIGSFVANVLCPVAGMIGMYLVGMSAEVTVCNRVQGVRYYAKYLLNVSSIAYNYTNIYKRGLNYEI